MKYEYNIRKFNLYNNKFKNYRTNMKDDKYIISKKKIKNVIYKINSEQCSNKYYLEYTLYSFKVYT